MAFGGAVTGGFGAAAVLASLLAPRRPLAIGIARLWGRVVLRLAGARLRIEGADTIPRQSYVVMSNHESALDIPALLAALPSWLRVQFLAKRSLFRIPFFGIVLRALGFIPVDRDDGGSAREMFERTLERIHRGHSVLVFPEATRSADGTLLPFSRGGFLVALRSHLPILPVGIQGSRSVLPPSSRSLRPGEIVVRVGDPIPADGLKVSHRRDLSDRCRDVIDELRGGRPASQGSPGPVAATT